MTDAAFLVATLLFLSCLVGLMIAAPYKERKCPHCRKAWAMQRTGLHKRSGDANLRGGNSETAFIDGRRIRLDDKGSMVELKCRHCGSTRWRHRTGRLPYRWFPPTMDG